MLCQECKQKQASVHLTTIINQQKMELHICEECARQRDEFMNIAAFSVNDLLASFMDIGKAGTPMEKPRMVKCAVCGTNYQQFKQIGRLGCQECYKYFKIELDSVLRKIQGRVEHTGKVPKRAGIGIRMRRQITNLKNELIKAIELEAFEKAAELRDQLKELEKQYNSVREGSQHELD